MGCFLSQIGSVYLFGLLETWFQLSGRGRPDFAYVNVLFEGHTRIGFGNGHLAIK